VFALIVFYVVSDIGALAGFTWFYLTLDRQAVAKVGAEAELGHT
jgi:hypothetical protein